MRVKAWPALSESLLRWRVRPGGVSLPPPKKLQRRFSPGSGHQEDFLDLGTLLAWCYGRTGGGTRELRPSAGALRTSGIFVVPLPLRPVSCDQPQNYQAKRAARGSSNDTRGLSRIEFDDRIVKKDGTHQEREKAKRKTEFVQHRICPRAGWPGTACGLTLPCPYSKELPAGRRVCL